MPNRLILETIDRLRANDPTLTIFNPTYTTISDEDAIAFAEALKTNTSLTHLDLSATEIGPVCLSALTKALMVNKRNTNAKSLLMIILFSAILFNLYL